MSRYTDTCERCGFTYVKGNIHFGDTCDRQKALREAGMSSGIQAELNSLRSKISRIRNVYWKVEGRPGTWRRPDALQMRKLWGFKVTRVLVLRKA